MLKKTLTAACCFIFIIGLMALRKPQPIKTVIIDAGHGMMKGGGYNGARGSFSFEDEICLAVAKKTVAQIAKDHPEIRIVETRPGKEIVGLHERADIANANKGDIFISIHVNAMPPIQHREVVGYETETYYTGKGKKKKKHTRKVAKYRYWNSYPSTKGTQTYIWGAHKADDKELAVRENAQMFTEENYNEKYGGVDPNSPEFIALSAVKTKRFWKNSARMADFIEAEFGKAGRVSQGSYQRQKGIWVLQATAMPSVLIETGFITNKEEEEYLNSESGQQEMAQCISRALGNYMDWLEKNKIQTAVSDGPQQGKPDAAATRQFLEAVERQEAAAKRGK